MEELCKLREIIKTLRSWGQTVEEFRFASGPFTRIKEAVSIATDFFPTINKTTDPFEFYVDGVRIVADLRVDFNRMYVGGPSLKESMEGINGIKYEVAGPASETDSHLTPQRWLEQVTAKLQSKARGLEKLIGEYVIVRFIGRDKTVACGILVGVDARADRFTLCYPQKPLTIQTHVPKLVEYPLSGVLHFERGELT